MPTVLEYSTSTPQKAARRRRWTWIVLALPSVVVPFVHFDCDVSPAWVVTSWAWDHDVNREGIMILAMAAGLIVGVPLFLWRLRLLWRRPVGQVERMAALVMAIGTLVAFVIASGTVVTSGDPDTPSWVATGVSVGVLIPGLIALWLGRRDRASGDYALVAMLVPYVANATFCVIGFIHEHQLGWYLAAVSTPAAIAETIVLTYGMLRRPTWVSAQTESPASFPTPGLVVQSIDQSGGLTPPNPAPP